MEGGELKKCWKNTLKILFQAYEISEEQVTAFNSKVSKWARCMQSPLITVLQNPLYQGSVTFSLQVRSSSRSHLVQMWGFGCIWWWGLWQQLLSPCCHGVKVQAAVGSSYLWAELSHSGPQPRKVADCWPTCLKFSLSVLAPKTWIRNKTIILYSVAAFRLYFPYQYSIFLASFKKLYHSFSEQLILRACMLFLHFFQTKKPARCNH